jgi:molecular chaperone HtpG
MEKLLIEQKQLKAASAKILEINPGHFLLRRIDMLLKSDEIQKAKELAWLTYDQACILEGERVADPKAFVTRLNSFLVA